MYNKEHHQMHCDYCTTPINNGDKIMLFAVATQGKGNRQKGTFDDMEFCSTKCLSRYLLTIGGEKPPSRIVSVHSPHTKDKQGQPESEVKE